MKGLQPQKTGDPCSADTAYESVVTLGLAQVVRDDLEKREILKLIVRKYTPDFKGAEISQRKVRGTAVVKIEILSMTGKYHR